MLHSPLNDLRYGLRGLAANPGFTLVAVLTLAIGIAINTTVFSWVDAVLLRPLPGVSNPGELAILESFGPDTNAPVSFRDIQDYRDRMRLVSGLAGAQETPFRLGEGENARRVWGELITGGYFDTLGVKPFLGRFLLPEEQGDKPGAFPLVILSHRLWTRYFHGDRHLIGKTTRINGNEMTVIGIAPPDFHGVAPGISFELWIPIVMAPQLNIDDMRMLTERGARSLTCIARLKPGVTLAQAQAEAISVADGIQGENPRVNKNVSARLASVSDGRNGTPGLLRTTLQVVMAMSALVLLIVCANVANLLLARATIRRREFSIRIALGGNRCRIARLVLTESLLLAALGAVGGIAMAVWGVHALSLLVPKTDLTLRIAELGLDFRILGFTTLVATGAAVAAGLAPALLSMRTEAVEGLKETGRGSTASGGSRRTRTLLVVSEVALATIALVGAGLFLRGFESARSIHPGFEARNVLVAGFHLSSSGYKADQLTQFSLRLRERLRATAGITAVTFAELVPLGIAGAGPGHRLDIEGYVPRDGEGMTIDRNIVSPGFFSLLRIPFAEGRDFTEHDDENSAGVAIVNETFARRFYAGASPIGRRIRNSGKWLTVVGMVRDSKYYRLSEAPLPYIYMPFRQFYGVGHGPGSLNLAFYLRTAGPPVAAMPILRREVNAIDPKAAGFTAMPLEEFNGASLFVQKLAVSILTTVGLMSLALAAIGLYGVMAYAVAQRTHEIGIRIAMGAQPGDVVRMVIRQGIVVTAVGLAAGLLIAAAGARMAAAFLDGVSSRDPLVFAGSALFLATVALVACYLPARRASKVDPINAFRCQ